MLREKKIKSIRIGTPGVDERLVTACDTEDCWKQATQFHGTEDHPVYSCDEHADAVMLEILSYFIPNKENTSAYFESD